MSRIDDTQEIKVQYGKGRTLRTVYGFTVTVIGFALLCWLPAQEWLRITIGSLIILLGGTMVSVTVMKSWFEMFGSLLPFGKKAGNG